MDRRNRMKLIPIGDFVTASWVVIVPENDTTKFDMLDDGNVANLEVALRVVDSGSNSDVESGDVIMTGINFDENAMNPFGQLVPSNLIFAKVDAGDREVVDYVEYFKRLELRK